MKFEIRQPYPGYQLSGIYVSAAPRGTPLGSHASDPTAFALAGANNFLGWLRRDVTVAGPTLEQHYWPGQTELPDKAGGYVTIERADEVDLEGADYLVASGGTNPIIAGSAPGTLVSFTGGKARLWQSGEVAHYKIAAHLTPETPGNLRVRLAAIR